ncbi:ribonuclease H-like domain-containing protein [Astrocystis sublimbata]|nr:ribonuclease H-like domain-containing protein [Astrocystis sublimbata]
MPVRPGYGTMGIKNIKLFANYFCLSLGSKTLRRYEWIPKSPNETSEKDDKAASKKKQEWKKPVGKKLGRIIQLCLESSELAPFQHRMVTDFRSVLITAAEINVAEITVTYRAEGQNEPRPGAPQYTMTLKKGVVYDLSGLITTLEQAKDVYAQDTPTAQTIQALNILMNHHAKSSSGFTTLGTNRAFPLTQTDETAEYLGAGVQAMRGYFTSVRAATARMLLNVNISHAAFYTHGRLDDLIEKYRTDSKDNSLYNLEFFLRNLRVELTHLPETGSNGRIISRVRKIHRFAHPDDGQNLLDLRPVVTKFGAGPEFVKFWLTETKGETAQSKSPTKVGKPNPSDRRLVSVYDYFMAHYDHRSKPNLPTINIGTGENPSYVPADVCYVMSGQPAKAQSLNSSQTTNMIGFAVQSPRVSLATITQRGLRDVGLNENPYLNAFDIQVAPNLIEVESRELDAPLLHYANQKRLDRIKQGSWSMVEKSSSLKFFEGTRLIHWGVLFISTHPRDAKLFEESRYRDPIQNNLAAALRSMGIVVKEQTRSDFLHLRFGIENKQLEDFFKKEIFGSQLELLFVILPEAQTPLVGSKISKQRGQDQYLRNLGLKVNLKLGGNNHLIDGKQLGFINDGKTMVIGIDVTHPAPVSKSPLSPNQEAVSNSSVAGMVASIDSNFNQFPGVLSLQEVKGEEMISKLGEMLESRLKLWSKHNQKRLPENLLVYRDGVSEGQYQLVLNKELPQLKKTCENMYPPNQQPRITIVIVGKRHHTRFYPTKDGDADNSGNPRAGTVVDRGVTQAANWDFFLQSHAAIKGTARPAHYVVLKDEIFRYRTNIKNQPKVAAPSSAPTMNFAVKYPPATQQGTSTPGGSKPGGNNLTKNAADELQLTTQSLCYAFGRSTKAVSYCAPAYFADVLCERGSLYVKSAKVLPNVHQRLRDTMFYI